MQIKMDSQAGPAPVFGRPGTDGNALADNESKSGADLDSTSDETTLLAAALRNLLRRYVNLVDSSTHGGWSLADEETVQATLAILKRAGSPVHRSV